jgi:hypothetical protein
VVSIFSSRFTAVANSCVSARRTNGCTTPCVKVLNSCAKLTPSTAHSRYPRLALAFHGAQEIDRRRERERVAQSTFCRHLMHGGALQLSKTKISVPLAVQRTPNWQKATRFLHVLSAFVITDGHLVRWSCSFRKKHAHGAPSKCSFER